MLRRFKADGFKSLVGAELDLPRMLVLFGPNAAGKSNFLEALHCLSRLVTERTIKDALAPPLRGYPIEAFRLPAGGLRGLMNLAETRFKLEAELLPEHRASGEARARRLRYHVEVQAAPAAGTFGVTDEYLAALQFKRDRPYGRPIIERQGQKFLVRIRGQGGRPPHEDVGQNHTTASVPAFAGNRYRDIETLRSELTAWRTYYLDPRVAMRVAQPPADVNDIGPLGDLVAPFLYRLRTQHPKCFEAVRRALRMVVPSVQDLDVDLNRERGELEMTVVQDGIHYPTRVISEGTLRVLALCALCVNPWQAALVAFEEPENGVHPRRLDLIADMLVSLALEDGTQVIVTTHSPRFCGAVLRRQHEQPERIALVAVRRERDRTAFRPFDPAGPLFQQTEVMTALGSATEDGAFEQLILRGLLDE